MNSFLSLPPWRLSLYTGLFPVAAGVAGALSAILAGSQQPVFLLRGGLLGILLAAMILAVEWRQGPEKLAAGTPPDWWTLFFYALITAMLASGLLTLPWFTFWAQHHDDLNLAPSVLCGPALFAVTTAFALLTALAWRFRTGPKMTLLRILAASSLAQFVRVLVDADPSPTGVLIFMIFCGLPFGLFWGLALVLFDPGFSPKRWCRLTVAEPGPENAPAKTDAAAPVRKR